MVTASRSLRAALAATASVAALAAVGLNGPGAAAAPTAAPPSPSQSKALAAQTAKNLVAARPAALKAGPSDTFVAKPVISVPEGLQYVPYVRTYKGLPVIGGDFVVVTDANGNVKATSVAQTSSIGNLGTKASVAAAKAQQTSRTKLSKVNSTGTPTLVVYALGTPRLAWATQVSGTKGDERSKQTVYVDAANGKVLGSKEHVLAGTGTSGYNGPNPITLNTQSSGGTFFLRDPASTTRQCQNAQNNTTYSGPDDVWGDGNPATRETGCVDAFFATQVEKNMLSSWLGRSGMDGSSGWVPTRVGLNDLNAFYDGTQVQIGHNQSNQWISSLDVVAHEYGHGIDDHTPGGISGSGTQEFVADTFGAATEAFANEPSPFDVPDYLVGEEVNLVGSGPIRNMYNPSALGDPNCYSSSIPGTEVHAAAGPGNHWYYLAAEGSAPGGGKPNSPTCNGSSVTGIGIQKVQRIMYNAMLMKTSASSYLRYRTWTLTAAKNLFPGSCTEFNTIKAAWDAVSVPAQTGDPTCTGTGGMTVNNPGNKSGTVGTAIASFTVTQTGGTAPISWSATGLPPGITIGASTGTVSGTPTTAGSYTVTVTARDSSSPQKTGSTQFTFSISPAGGGCSSPGQKFGNPGFESGRTVWSATAGVIDNSTGRPARTGSWKAWLDGYGITHTDTLSQSVTIPAGCAATLTFWIRIDSSETTSTIQYDKLTVKANSTTLATYSNLNENTTYTQKSFNLSSFAGQTVNVNFTGTEDISLQTSFVIDDTALTLS
jgi:Zn-dependent metalloprotease